MGLSEDDDSEEFGSLPSSVLGFQSDLQKAT